MSNPEWITAIYGLVATVGAFLAIFVMQKTEKDKINMVDPLFLQWVRRFAFVAVSFALCYSVISEWERSVPVLLMVASGVANLAVNAIALQNRSTPRGRVRLAQLQPRRVRSAKPTT